MQLLRNFGVACGSRRLPIRATITALFISGNDPLISLKPKPAKALKDVGFMLCR
jgi:hypothetical protein